ncbi:hypothetical protein PO883_06515 [Massilia sp. DJPM01]|uniref:hypothetical protein n=1 Tax=Massilia sp. DJPM01 TaxID=3024404 RepID=UPI00259D71A3|nr:hypothetical protein [Massilia sp. DJPM01]MDM5176850.1 hypothetical protein [Massilia sp. DJPM01]
MRLPEIIRKVIGNAMGVTKKRLVKLLGNTYFYADIDERRLRCDTVELLVYIRSHIDPDNDEHEVWKWVVPVCESVLACTISLPVPFYELPLKYAVRERLLTPEFEKVLAEFSLTISGSPREVYEEIVIDGVRHAYVEFEE